MFTFQDYIRLLNIGTGKCIAILLVIAFAIYHSMLHATYGVTPCKGLLKDGMYKGAQWQPWGCMMHKYTKTDSERCFRYNNFWGKKNHLVYVGDDRVFQLYSAMRRWLEAGLEPTETWGDNQRLGKEIGHQSWESGALNLKVDFLWAPMVDESMSKAIAKWHTGPGPTVVVLGAGTEAIMMSNSSEVALDEHRRNLTKLRPDLENMAEFGGSKVLWGFQVIITTFSSSPTFPQILYS